MSVPFVSRQPLPKFELWDHVKGQRIPFSFDLELTARCNNDCRHCYLNLPASDQAAHSRELAFTEITAIARQAVDLGALWCLITGGEPLLRNDFPEIYLALKKQGLLLSVFTNACLITEQHVSLFQQYPPREIEVSVYGITQATYERVTRKPGSYVAFRRGLDRLLEGGVKVRLKAMALRSNLHELPDIAAFCRLHTKDTFRFDPLLHLRYDKDSIRNAEIQSERLSPQEIVSVEQADPERRLSLQKDCASLIRQGVTTTTHKWLFSCGAGINSFSVSYDGAFRLCSSLNRAGCTFDLRTGSLAEAWQVFVPTVRGLHSSRAEYQEACGSCPLVNLCLWCPAHADLECGQLDAHTGYFCEVAQARAEGIRNSRPIENPGG